MARPWFRKPVPRKGLAGSSPAPTAMVNFFQKKKKKRVPKTLKEAWRLYQKLEQDFENLEKELKDFKKQSNLFVQKVGIVRFNPFREIGGDQSFSIALLDAQDNGIVLTSLYSRAGNRVYAKPVEQGISKYQLSEEEKKAIKQAKGL